MKNVFRNIWTDQKATLIGAIGAAIGTAITTMNPAVGAIVCPIITAIVGAILKNPGESPAANSEG